MQDTTTPAAEPLIDKFGRSYTQLVAIGKKILPKLNKRTRLFMPKGGRHKKPAMETPITPPPSAITSEPAAPAAVVEAVHETPPEFADVRKALNTLPAAEGDARPTPEGLADELKAIGDNPTAETIVGLIQTGLILIGEEEGYLTPLEKDLIRRPLVRVLAKYGVGKDVLPPEVDLVLAVLGIVAVRLQKPKTATFAAKVRAWVVEKFFGSKGKKLATQLRSEVGESVTHHEPAK